MAIRIALALAAALMLAACASEVTRQPVELAVAVAEAGREYALRDDVAFTTEARYPRSLRAGTRFSVVGRVAQGLVLKPTDAVLTLEGRHVHEAYAVLRDDLLVGFYLPVERAFSPLSPPAAFPLVERKP